jgi:superfamily II DNA helicase RecQ
VFHVAITRGRSRVHVLSGGRPSPFIDECLHLPDPSLRDAERTTAAQTARAPRVAAAPTVELTTSESALFEELRSVRRHLAAGKPAYTVLSDQTLRELARRRPTTLAALGNVKGMGPVKLERYGSVLLAVIEAAIVP